MESIAQHIQGIISALVAVDVSDLSALAKVHTQLQHLSAAASDRPGRPTEGDTVDTTIADITGTVEKLVLGLESDSAAVVDTIAHSLHDLLLFLEEGPFAAGAPAIAAAIPTLVTAPPAPSPVAALVEKPIAETDIALVGEFIAESNTHLDAAEAALLVLEATPGDHEAINLVFRSFHTIKGVAGFLDLKQIGSLAHAAESLLDKARQGTVELRGQPADLVLESLDSMRGLLRALEASVAAGGVQPSLATLPELLSRLGASATGAQLPPAVTSAKGDEAPKKPEPATNSGEPGAGDGARAAASATQSTVKVGTARLDNLVNLVGELLIAQSMVRQGAEGFTTQNPALVRRLSHLGKITRELQDLSMAMRMVPIRAVFQKMARLVRDVARKAGKQVELVTVGDETELDRNVVEAVSDPLVHMVRNAVDHGIESAADRSASGKPAAGRIELRAFHQGGSIVIQIQDDGRGLNTDKILKKAKAAGLVREGQTLSEQEVFGLIFHAGLSTAEKVTDVSGRGVGMDVVKRNIEALRGRVEIASTPGKGSLFSIRLPLTLAMIDGMLVRVQGSRFIIPLTNIERNIQLTDDQRSTVQGRGEVCLVRGQLLPLYRLADVLGVECDGVAASGTLAVILHDNGRRCCLLVDELLGQQQVVIKSLGRGIGAVPAVSGGAILGDGSVSLILDVPGLMGLTADVQGAQLVNEKEAA